MSQHKCPTCSSNISFKHYLKNGFKKYPECPYCLRAYGWDEIGFKTIFFISLFHLTCIVSIFLERKYKTHYLLDFSALVFFASNIFIGYFLCPPLKTPPTKSSLKEDFGYLAKIFAINGIISVLFFSIIIIVLYFFKEQIKDYLT